MKASIEVRTEHRAGEAISRRTYQRGCRCDGCTAANTATRRRWGLGPTYLAGSAVSRTPELRGRFARGDALAIEYLIAARDPSTSVIMRTLGVTYEQVQAARLRLAGVDPLLMSA